MPSCRSLTTSPKFVWLSSSLGVDEMTPPSLVFYLALPRVVNGQ